MCHDAKAASRLKNTYAEGCKAESDAHHDSCVCLELICERSNERILATVTERTSASRGTSRFGRIASGVQLAARDRNGAVQKAL